MWGCWLAIVGTLAACGSVPMATRAPVESPRSPAVSAPAAVNAPAVVQARSRWVPVPWEALPGWGSDSLFEAWNAWLKSCEKPQPPVGCPVRRCAPLEHRQRAGANGMDAVTPAAGPGGNTPKARLPVCLPAITNPLLKPAAIRRPDSPCPSTSCLQGWPPASRGLHVRKWIPCPKHRQPCAAKPLLTWRTRWMRWCCRFKAPAGCASRSPTGVNAGSGWRTPAPTTSPTGVWGAGCLDQGLIKDASWPGIKAWLAQNPQRQQELLWANPRVVFFKEEVLGDLDAAFGPRGAQGVALTPGRSIAVDPGSIPYGHLCGWRPTGIKQICKNWFWRKIPAVPLQGPCGQITLQAGGLRLQSLRGACVNPCKCGFCGPNKPETVSMDTLNL